MTLLNISLIFIFQSLEQQGKEGLIVVTILFILMFFGVIYVQIENKKDDEEREKWKKIKQNKFLDDQVKFNEALLILEKIVSSCKKCENSYYKIWNIDDSIEIRCETCKRKQLISLNATDYQLFLDSFNSYINLISKIPEEQNEKIRNLMLSLIQYDFFNLRANTPYIRAITLLGKNTETYQKEEIKLNKSRRISQTVKDKVWRRDEGKCIECGSNEKLEFDHIIPFSKGGANTYRNIQLLCEPCNRSKSDKIG
jgi:hypothetical protein